MAQNLPATHKALVCEAVGSPFQLQTLPTPTPTHGSVVIKVLAVMADSGARHHIKGGFFTFPTPFTPGTRAVGRVAAVGPDTTSLSVGQLVLTDPWVRARDDPDVQILWGVYDGPSDKSKKFMADNWRYGNLAEYVRAPLENTYALNEKVLCGDLGYTTAELVNLGVQVVPMGGFRGIDLKPGETVIVAPATGGFSGAAVGVAAALGANVIAVSRNLDSLKKVQAAHPRVNVVQLKGDVAEDTAALKQFGPVDAFIDLSPPEANGSTHIKSCLLALKPYGRASLMGVIHQDIAIPYIAAMFNNLTIRGQYMYEREDVRLAIKMAESGLLKLGKRGGQEVVESFKLEDFDRAFDKSAESKGFGRSVVIEP